MQIRAFKFINGEEIIAEIVNVTDAAITIKNPLTTTMVKGPDGNPTLAFGQWSFVLAENVDIDLIVTSLLALPMELHPEVAAAYSQNFSSILLPTPPTSKQIIFG